MTDPTPAETSAAKVAPAPAKATPVSDAAGQVVKEVQNVENAYQEARVVTPAVEDAAKPLGKEPALVIGTATAVVIAVLSLTHVVDVNTATGFVTSIAPLLGGFLTRFVVKPV